MFTFIAKAPARIDLGGGTLDMWPLYLRLQSSQPSTLNLAISIFASVQLIAEKKRKPEPSMTLTFKDGPQARIAWKDLAKYEDEAFRWPVLILRRLLLTSPKEDLSFLIQTESPRGAGLGGSSTLGVAFLSALQHYTKDQTRGSDTSIRLIRDFEAELLGIPTGIQDYMSAMYGGLQSLNWKPGDQHLRRTLSEKTATAFAEKCLLFYSGASRQSGINNWAVFKAALDPANPRTLKKLENIAITTKHLTKAVEAEHWTDVCEGLQQEWSLRKQLSPGVTTTPFESFLKNTSSTHKVAGKFCGAGGGGCFFLFFPHITESDKKKIIQEAMQQGFQYLPFEAELAGIKA